MKESIESLLWCHKIVTLRKGLLVYALYREEYRLSGLAGET
jgi:hypothetical protein